MLTYCRACCVCGWLGTYRHTHTRKQNIHIACAIDINYLCNRYCLSLIRMPCDVCLSIALQKALSHVCCGVVKYIHTYKSIYVKIACSCIHEKDGGGQLSFTVLPLAAAWMREMQAAVLLREERSKFSCHLRAPLCVIDHCDLPDHHNYMDKCKCVCVCVCVHINML